jgi:hypothetical protein
MSGQRDKERDDYRSALLDCDKKSVEEYDKAVMTLSGGAIGVSFAFLKDIVGSGTLHATFFLLFAWCVWGMSITAVLFSHYCSHRSMRRALIDLADNNLNYHKPGRRWDDAINFLNPFGGILFFIGLCSLLWFVSQNLKHPAQADQSNKQSAMVTTTTTTTVTSTTESRNASPVVGTNANLKRLSTTNNAVNVP